ncbi:YutD family protein [Streptococcus rifensis]
MKREITPEMYNYNKYPGPKFERLMDQVRSEEIALTLVDNYKEAFDLRAFEQRFTAYMLKFDYIVGDWGNEQLRLKGFYKDENTEEIALKISRLEDYLLEFCNYGCAYFVLENPNPQEPEIEAEEMRSSRQQERGRRRRRRPRQNQNQERNVDNQTQQASKRSEPRYHSKSSDKVPEQAAEKPKRNRKRNNRSKTEKRHFGIKDNKLSSPQTEPSPVVKKEVISGKRDFIIRQK